MTDDAPFARRPDRRLPADLPIVAALQRLSAPKRRLLVATLGEEEGAALAEAWREWAHDGQLAPSGGWSTWVMMAGRGFGKTLAATHWLLERIAERDDLSIALVGASLEDARRVMVEGRSGLLTVGAAWVDRWEPSLRRLTFKGGSVATLFSGASPDLLRGPEHHLAWCDELAKWERAQDCWDMLQLGLRLGGHPQALVTTTPRPGPALRDIIAAPGAVLTRGRTRANPHLAKAWKARMEARYAGTRLGRQELDGELLPEAGALWTPELIERCRVAAAAPVIPAASREAVPLFTRTLVAVDPPAGEGTCGIVAVALGSDGVACVLADHSVTGRSPEGWTRAVAAAAAAHATTEVVVETNQGGLMVKTILLAAEPRLRVHPVTATLGKAARAEPVAHLFEAGRVRLNGRMPELEAQLCGLIAGGGYEGPGASPDRADAMVWGVSEIMRPVGARVRAI